MRTYKYIAILALVGCTIAFTSCKQMEQMAAPVIPDPEPTEVVEPTAVMEPESEPQLVIIDDPVLSIEIVAGNINGATYSPDGKYIAGSLATRSIQLWDSQNGETVKTFDGHTNDVWATAFTSDGQILASAGVDNTVGLWNVSTGENLHFLTGHTNDVRSVSISSDDTTVASASLDGSIKLWSVSTGELLLTVPDAHSAAGVGSVDFIPDGQLLATGGADNTVRLWSNTGQLLNTFEGHTGPVETVAWSPDGQFLASASRDWTVRIWNPTTGEPLHTLTGLIQSLGALMVNCLQPEAAFLMEQVAILLSVCGMHLQESLSLPLLKDSMMLKVWILVQMGKCLFLDLMTAR